MPEHCSQLSLEAQQEHAIFFSKCHVFLSKKFRIDNKLIIFYYKLDKVAEK